MEFHGGSRNNQLVQHMYIHATVIKEFNFRTSFLNVWYTSCQFVDSYRHAWSIIKQLVATVYVTGFVKLDPNHTGTEIHFIAEH